MENFKEKYLEYKTKYLLLKQQVGGNDNEDLHDFFEYISKNLSVQQVFNKLPNKGRGLILLQNSATNINSFSLSGRKRTTQEIAEEYFMA